MKAGKTETTYETAQDEEMQKFYRALAIAQARSILHVMNAKDAEERKTRAAEITEELMAFATKRSPRDETFAGVRGRDRCGPNEIFNPITQQCEPA